jgi:hypothetical protein
MKLGHNSIGIDAQYQALKLCSINQVTTVAQMYECPWGALCYPSVAFLAYSDIRLSGHICMPWTGRHDIELVVVSRDDGGKAIYYDFETGEVQSEEWVAAMANRLEKHVKHEPVKSSHHRQRKVLGIFYFHMCGDLVYLVHPLLVAERPRTADSDSFHSDVTLRFEDAPYIKDAVAYFKSKSPILCYECHGLTFIAGCQVCVNACMHLRK